MSEMKSATTVFQWIVRITGLIQIVLGIAIWTGNFDNLIRYHILDGLIFVVALIVLAVLAAAARVQAGLVVLALIWALVVIALGLTQRQLVPGPAHWVIQVVHLLVGLGAIAQGETLARRIHGRLAASVAAKKRVSGTA
jgi:hypothetical protein